MTEPERPADLTESQRWIIELNELDSDASDTHPCQGGNCEGVGLITTDDIAEGCAQARQMTADWYLNWYLGCSDVAG